MTEDERKALQWLDNWNVKPVVDQLHDCNRHIRTLKAMASRPALPEEPDGYALSAMLEASAAAVHLPKMAAWEAIYRALHAHLTAPKTKEVEVWRVEYAREVWVNGCPSIGWKAAIEDYDTRADAEAAASAYRSGPKRCVTVTGPHKQQVPAG